MYLKDRKLENYWAADIETDDLDATKIWLCCVENVKTREKKVFFNGEEFRKWYDRTTTILVTHNGLSFDCPVLNRLWLARIPLSRVVDTLVLSFLYNPKLPVPHDYVVQMRKAGRKAKGAHSLDVWGFRLGNFKLQFDDWSQLTPKMQEYCEQDTSLTVDLFLRLSHQMNKLGYSELSAAIEHHFRVLIDKQQAIGFKFDTVRANMLYLSLREKQYRLEKEVHKVFPPKLVLHKTFKYKVKKDGSPTATFKRHLETYPKVQLNASQTMYRVFKLKHFNIGSPIQRAEALLSLKWQPKSFTPKGNPKIDEESVLEFAKIEPRVEPIAKWLVVNGRANMIKTWLNNLNREDNCIHGRVLSCGAGTRRCTHSAPNSANVPAIDAAYGKAARSLWVARPKRVLVGIDASGLEGRVFIHYLGSKEAEEFMLNDPHTANAEAISEALGFTVERQTAKTLFYARLYGASDYKLGSTIGGTSESGARIRSAIDNNIPGFAALVTQIEREFDDNGGRIRTIDGGFVKCPSPHSALNYKFQSCGAIIMKKANIILSQYIRKERLDALKVGDIHDEWQYDCLPEHADRLGQLACEAMTEAGKALDLNILIEGEYSIGRNWAETH